jgi:RsmE family RNA methyltransferase
LQDEDFSSNTRVSLSGRRLEHVLEVHRAVVGDRLRVGKIGGLVGDGRVLKLSAEVLELEVFLQHPPPAPLSLSLVLALPRPKMLKRVLQAVTTLGVKQIYLLNSCRVEKSFWGSPLLQPEKLQEQLVLGLEQACDTILPQVHLRQRFKPFVEDELPALAEGRQAFVAHPLAAVDCPCNGAGETLLAVGPEGGFIPYEIEKLEECGFLPISLGPRILRVETAVPVLISRLSPA